MMTMIPSITQEIIDNGGLLVGGPGVCAWSESVVPLLQGTVNRTTSFVDKMGGTQAKQNRRFLAPGVDSVVYIYGFDPGPGPVSIHACEHPAHHHAMQRHRLHTRCNAGSWPLLRRQPHVTAHVATIGI
jgi:hypothetical protein